MNHIKHFLILFACIFSICNCKSKSVEDLIIDKYMEGGDIEQLFKVWNYIYKKAKYSTDNDEYQYRLKIFKSKVEEIKTWNADSTKSWKKGLNKFSDLTQEEFRKKYLTNIEDFIFKKSGNNEYFAANGLINYDYYVENSSIYSFAPIDWKDESGPIDDQGECGSCYAFATLNAIETSYYLKTGERVKLSRQQIVDCNIKTSGCNGGWATNVAVYARSQGLMLESDYPYTQVKGTCNYDSSKAKIYITGISGHTQPEKFYTLKKYTPSYLYEQLKKGPVVVGIDGDSLADYKGGNWGPEGCYKMNHAVLVVGFGFDEYKLPYWIIKNSWGEKWGENGFFRFLGRESDSTGNCFLYYFPYKPFYNESQS